MDCFRCIILHNQNGGNMKENVIVEIRAAEGGNDSKSLVIDQYHIYAKMATKNCL